MLILTLQDQARSKSTGRALRPTSKSNEDARRSKKGRQRGREASDTRSDGEEGGGAKPGAGARSWWAWPAAAPARPVATVDGSGASSLSSGSKLSDGGQAAASIRALKVCRSLQQWAWHCCRHLAQPILCPCRAVRVAPCQTTLCTGPTCHQTAKQPLHLLSNRGLQSDGASHMWTDC